MYLGECNPRITGASSMTNLAAFAHADAPLFLFHLLEWMGIDYELDVDELNARWADPDEHRLLEPARHQAHRTTTVDRICRAPPSRRLGARSPTGGDVRTSGRRRTDAPCSSENRAFFLRIAGAGDYRYEGADLGILVSPGRFMDDDFRLNDRAKAWIKGIRRHYVGAPSGGRGGARWPKPSEDIGFKLL